MPESLWPVHPKPLKGEILSSWLSRIADGYNLELAEFRKNYLPKTKGINSDLDLMPMPEFFEALASGTGIGADQARQTGFAIDEGYVYSRWIHGYPEWVIPAAVRKRSFGGMPFCPSCLATDKVPYYRKFWRYAFYPVCPEHGLLTNICPDCKRPYFYLGTSKDHDAVARAATINHCRGCGYKFQSMAIASGLSDQVLASVVVIQSRIMDGLESGWVAVPNRGMTQVCLYLRGLHDLALVLERSGSGKKAIEWIASEIGMPIPASLDWGDRLECHPPSVRAWLLYLVDWLHEEWPARLVSLMKAFDWTPADFLPYWNAGPFWLTDPGIDRLNGRAFGSSKKEFRSARVLLAQKRGYPPSIADLAEFMRTGKIPQAKPGPKAHIRKSKQDFQTAESDYKARKQELKVNRIQDKNAPRDLYPPVSTNPIEQARNADIEEASEDIEALRNEVKQKKE